MKKFIFAAVCIVAMSCSDEIELTGNNATSEFLQDGFTGVGVQDGFELYIINDTVEPKVRIETDEKAISHVKHTIKQGMLYFYKEKDVEFPSDALVKIYVTKDSLSALIASSSKIIISDTLRNENVNVKISNMGSIEGRIECVNLTSIINNSSSSISGQVSNLMLNTYSGSNVNSIGLRSDNVKANISGGSSVYLFVNNELELEATEGSYMGYRGTGIIRSMLLEDDSKLEKLN